MVRSSSVLRYLPTVPPSWSLVSIRIGMLRSDTPLGFGRQRTWPVVAAAHFGILLLGASDPLPPRHRPVHLFPSSSSLALDAGLGPASGEAPAWRYPLPAAPSHPRHVFRRHPHPHDSALVVLPPHFSQEICK